MNRPDGASLRGQASVRTYGERDPTDRSACYTRNGSHTPALTRCREFHAVQARMARRRLRCGCYGRIIAGVTGDEDNRPGPQRKETAAEDAWLLVAVSTAGGADSLRVHVWRKLRGLGAVYVQQSVCLLPDRPPVAATVRKLADKVRAGGGTARCLHLTLTDPVERGELIGEFRASVTAEYSEVLQRLPAFFTEIETETAKGHTTFAEVEESEADLARFEAWVAKIEARDYFAAPIGAEVRAELDRARKAMKAFEAAALAAETAPHTGTGHGALQPGAAERQGHRP